MLILSLSYQSITHSYTHSVCLSSRVLFDSHMVVSSCDREDNICFFAFVVVVVFVCVCLCVWVCVVHRLKQANNATAVMPYKQSLPFQLEQPGTIHSNKFIVTSGGLLTWFIGIICDDNDDEQCVEMALTNTNSNKHTNSTITRTAVSSSSSRICVACVFPLLHPVTLFDPYRQQPCVPLVMIIIRTTTTIITSWLACTGTDRTVYHLFHREMNTGNQVAKWRFPAAENTFFHPVQCFLTEWILRMAAQCLNRCIIFHSSIIT